MTANFVSSETDHLDLGPCGCPGQPHASDSAEVRREVSWGVLLEVGSLTGAAAYGRLVEGALAAWSFVDEAGTAVPITAETVGHLHHDRLNRIAAAVNAAYERATAPLPNGSGAGSPRLPRAIGSSTRRTRRTGKRTS